jgi:uncharacterized protein (DUF1778 family)
VVDQPVQRPTSERRKGRKEVTTRMPAELADGIRDAASKQGLTVNDYIIALASEAVRDGRPVSGPAVRAQVRRTLEAALAALDEEEELPVSA